MAVTALIVGRGIANGIESACKILMPLLIGLIIVLAAYSISHGELHSTVHFLFGIDPTSVGPKVALEALGLSFFSIGVGFAVMITYGGHAESGIDLRQVAIATLLGDTAVSFLAGFAVFPVVFAEKLDPAGGPGLIFVTLPLAFSKLPFGTFAAVMFFVLVAVAAIASAISMLELPVSFLEQRLAFSRGSATVVSALSCGLIGLLSVLSFNVWANWYPLASIGVANVTVFELLDQLTSNILLPNWQLCDRNLRWLDNFFEVVGQRTGAWRIWRRINSRIAALHRSASDCHRQCRGRAILSGLSNG